VVWSESDSSRRRARLRDEGALPLRPGDRIRVEATLSQPAYVYLLWIDTSGAASPVYPWLRGDWSQRPDEELPVDRLSLPRPGDAGWPVQPPLGTEVLMLLARDTPLPRDVELSELLSGLPIQQMADPGKAVWFHDGTMDPESAVQLRSVDLTGAKPVDDALLQAQRELDGRMAPHFQLRRTVAFASDDRE
jgi:hypothetical protein